MKPVWEWSEFITKYEGHSNLPPDPDTVTSSPLCYPFTDHPEINMASFHVNVYKLHTDTVAYVNAFETTR